MYILYSSPNRIGKIINPLGVLRTLMVFVILFSGHLAWSQFDYQFWMPPIWDVGDSDKNNPSELFITTPYATSVSVHVETPDGVTFVYNGTVSSGAPLSIPLTALRGQTTLFNQVISNNGFIITASAPIQCVHKVSAEFNQTLVTLKGKNGRGRDFWCGSQVRNNANSYGTTERHFISVMAMEDNTSITFKTPYAMDLTGPGDLSNPYTITLNKYQCYLIRSNATNQHVAGAHVTSTKDIVVISGSTHTRISGSGADAADGGTDQLVPLEKVGKSYAVIKGNNNNPYDYAIVVATENNTKVYIDGNATPVTTIANAGQYYDWTLTGSFGSPHSIATDKPVYLYHVSGTSQDDEVDMSIMPQLQCTGSRYIEFSKFTTNTSQQIMQLIVSPTAEPTLKVNNVAYQNVPDVIHHPIPGLPGWRSVTLPTNSLSNNNIVKSNGFFHAGWLTGNAGKTGAYGFLSGFDDAIEFLDPVSSLPTNIYSLGPLCQGQSLDHCMSIMSCGGDHEIVSYSGNQGNIVVAPPSSPYDSCFRYTAPPNFTGYDTIHFVVANSFGFQNELTVVIKVAKPNTPINAGQDQTLCSVSTTTLSAVNPDPLANGYWTVAQGGSTLVSPNSPITNVTGLSPGVNTFIWHQDYPSCAVNNVDLVQVFVFSGTPPNADAGQDANLCSGTTYTMQANNPGFSGQGTWEILSGNATISNINSPTASVTNLAIGVNTFRWNISNGSCPGGETSDVMLIKVYNQNHPAANAGPDQTACQGSFNSLAIAGNAPQIPATGQWSVVSGSGNFANPNNPSTNVSGLSIGVNVFRWTINNGPCGTLTDDMQITVYNPASPAANAGPDQSLCLPTNTTTLAGNSPISPATGLWTVVQGTGSFANPSLFNTTVNGLSQGTNRFRWTLNNGACTNPVTFDEMVVTVYPAAQPAISAGANQELCFMGSPLTTTLSGSNVIAPGTGLWTVVNGSGTFGSPTLSATTVTGMSMGVNTYQWTVTNGSCGTPQSAQVTVTVFNNGIASANAGPDTQICSPTNSYTMQAVAPTLPATGYWTLIAGTGVLSNPSSPITAVTNLGIGNNVFRWTINNGACAGSNFDDVVISVFNHTAPSAQAGADQSFCYNGVAPITATMAANSPVAPGSGTWTLVSGGGTIVNVNSPTTDITAPPIGINIFQWTIYNGTCGTTSDQVAIVVYNPNQTNANAGADQQICSTTPSVSLSANALLPPATGQWTVVSGNGTFSNPTSSATTVTGLSLGNNVFRWTINNGPCSTPSILSDEVTVTVFASNQLPANAGPDQSICSTTTTVTLAGNTATLPATGQWSVIAGSGNFSNPASPISTVTGMSIGTNIYEWKITNGSCGSPTADQMSVTVYSATAPVANAGADQEYCLPVTSASLQGNAPLFPATGVWSLVSGTGTLANPSSPASGVSGLSQGQNKFRWTIDNGSCGTITHDEIIITIYNSGQAGPNAGPDASLCTPQSTYTMQATALPLPATGQWTLLSGIGTISNPADPHTTISGLGVGANVFRWKVSNGPCPAGTDYDDVTIFLFDANQLPAYAGTDQSYCSDGISPVNAVMNASPVIYPGSGLWTLIQGGGTIANISSPTTAINNLPVGENIFRWTTYNGACLPATTFDEISIFVYPGNQPAANAGSDQQLCSTNPTTILSGNAVTFPATGLWTVVQGAATFADATNPTTSVSNLGMGTNILQWKITNGSCNPSTTADQVIITVFNNAQAAANAGPNQSICSTTSSIAMAGNAAIFPATGQWTLISGTGTFSNANSPVTSVTGMGLGTNIYQWTINNGVCGGLTSNQITVTVYDVNAPAANAGADQSYCLPTTSSVFAGNTAVFPATGEWTLLSGIGTISNPSSPTSTVTGLGVGSNIFRWTINNGACGSITHDDMTLLIFDSGQSGPDAGPDASLCTPQSTYVMQANAVIFPAVGTWSKISGTGTISNINNPTATISGLGVGTNVFRWTITNGPCPVGSNFDEITILVYDATQPAANAGPNQSLCSSGSPVNTTMNGSVIIPPATGTWTLIQGGGTITSPNVPTTTITNLPVGENIFRWTVRNGACTPTTTFDEVSIFVYPGNQPAAEAGPDQQLCSTNPTTTLAANAVTFPASGLWTVVQGNAVFANAASPTTSVSGLGIGTNILRWTISNGPCLPPTTSDVVTITVFNNAQATAYAGPDISVCSTQSSITLSGNAAAPPATPLWTLVSGTGTIATPGNNVTSVSGLSIGQNVFQYTISNGPCAAPTSDQIVVTVFPSNQPAANAGPDQYICLPQTNTVLAGNAPIAPGTGYWTRISGSGNIIDPTNPNSSVTGLTVGQNIFQWTISNGPCLPATTSDQVSLFIYDNMQPVANAGQDASFCTPQSTYVMQANTAIFPAQGTWTLISGTATIANVNNPTTQISGLGIGTNIFRWTINNGPCVGGMTFDDMTIFIYDENQPTANAGIDQSFCFDGIFPVNTVMSASAVVSPGSGTWTLVQGSGTIASANSPTTAITNLGVGENIFQWSVNNGPCLPSNTTDQISIFVYPGNQPAANAGPDQQLCSTNPTTTLAGNAVVFPASGNWTVVQGAATFANASNPTTSVSNLSVGTNILRWKISNGTCIPGSTFDDVVITVFDNAQLTAHAGADQSICSTQNSITVSGTVTSLPATSLWTLVSGSGTITSPNSNTTTISGLSIGTNVFEYTVFNGPCSASTVDQMVVTVYSANQPAATAGTDQSICLPQTTVTLAGNTPIFPATGTWTLVSGNGTIANIGNPNSAVTGLTVGENVFQWKITNGPCAPSTTSDQVSIFVYDNTQPAANAGADKNFCEPVSSTTLSGNTPIYPATGQWTLISGTGSILNINSASTLVNGLTTGENIFQWTITNGPCAGAVTSDQVSIFIYDKDQLPADAGTDQFLCTPIATTVMNANSVTFPATGIWTLISGSGSISTPASPTTEITNLAIGENIFRWTITNGPCPNSTTFDDVSIFVYDSGAPAADAGPTQSVCTPTNSVTMVANAAVFPAVGTWTLISGTGNIVSPHSPSTQITGLGLGENVFQWTIDNHTCGTGTTQSMVSIFVYSALSPSADAGQDQDLCTPQTNTILHGSVPIYPSTGEWTLLSGTGTILDPTNPITEVVNLGIGLNVFRWTVLNGPCANANTSDDVTITLYNGGAAAPFAGLDQQLCSPQSSTEFTADPAEFPGIGTWSVINGTGVFSDPNDPTATVTGLSIGVNTFHWNVNYSTCGSPSDDVSIIVYDSSQGASNAGEDQYLCSDDPSTTMDADPVLLPGEGTWSLLSGSAIITNTHSPITHISNLGVGANVFVWTLYNGPCLAQELTTDTMVVYVFDKNVTAANAGPDQSFCTPVSSTNVNGNTLIYPQTGLWELLQGTGNIENPLSSNTTITNLSVGENIFRWTTDNGVCSNSLTSDLISIFIYDENQLPADAGEDQSFCSPISDAVLNGNTITFPAVGTWSLISGTGIIDNPNDPNTTVSGLSIGENIFQWKIINGPCAIPTTDQVSIFIYDENNPLANAGTDQEICLPQNSVTMQASTYVFPATGTWTMIQGISGTIQDIHNPQTGISNLSPGVNVFVWTVVNGVCDQALTTDTVEIRVYEPDAAPADAGTDQWLCTPTSQTTMTAAVPEYPGYGTWSVVSGSATILDIHNPTTVIQNLQQGETVLQWSVYNGACPNANTIDQISIFIYDRNQPEADAGIDQDLCTPVTTTAISANDVIFPAIGYWTLISGQGDIQDINSPTTQISNLAIGENIFRWTIENGPCDPQVTTDDVVVYLFDSDQPDADAGADQEFCLPTTDAVLTGSNIVGSSTGLWTLISGGGTMDNPTSPQTAVHDLPVGENVFVWTVNNGSCGTTMDTTSVFIFDNDAPEADAGEDVSFCTPVSTYIMAANTPDAPGVGTWVLVNGNGTISDIHAPSSAISGLTIGENTFSWTIYNGPCEEPTTDFISIFIYDENLEPAKAGDDQEICLPLNSVNMAANYPVFPATGTWTQIAGSSIIDNASDPLTTISALSTGENIFVWTFENGPCDGSVTSDTISIKVFDPNAIVADAGQDQSLCTPESSTFLTAAVPTIPGIGTWSVISGTGTFADIHDPNTEVSGLSVGENVFEWMVYNGPCDVTHTVDQVSIFLFDADQLDANAGPNQFSCTPVTTAVMNANSVIFPAIGTWTIIQGNGNIADASDPYTVVSDLAPGVNILMWTIDNGPCANGITTDTVEIHIFNNDQTPANAGTDQEICLPLNNVQLQANTLTGAATGLWTLLSGEGNIEEPTHELTTVSNLPVGTHVFVWSQDNGPCGISTDTVSVSVFDPTADVANAGNDVSFCTPISSYTMTANTPSIPGVGTWALVSGTGSIDSIHSPSANISGLTIGENIFSWTIYNGPCATPTVDYISIFIFDENLENANAGQDQEICLPQNSVTMTANSPVFPAIGQWTLQSGTGDITNPNDPTTAITSLAVGVNTFAWMFNNGPCENAMTTDEVSILVFDPNAPVAFAGNDQFLCTPTTSTALTALTPTVPGLGTWTVVNGSGVFADIHDPLTTVTGLSVGENIFQWVVYNGPCGVTNTSDLVSIFLFDQNQPNANAGINQDFCTPVNTVQLSGSGLIFPASGEWTVTQGSVTFANANDPNTTISNITPGVNILTWTVNNGTCPNGTTLDDVVISVFDANQSPANAGTDQEWCLPVTSATLQANPLIAAATGEWTLISGGGTIANPTYETTMITDLPVGINTFVWTLNNGPCSITSDTVSVIIFDPMAPPANAGTDVDYCTPVSSHTMSANTPAIPGTGTWAVVSGNGSFDNVNAPNAVVSGLTVGQHVFSWTIYNGPCATPTTDLISVFIYDQNMPAANANQDQELCAPASTAVMAGNNPIFPGTGTWSLISGTGILADNTNPTTTVSGLSIGTNVFVWSFDNGPCQNALTADTVEIRVYDPIALSAYAGTDQSLCTPESSAQLQATIPNAPGVGTWIVVNGTGTFNDPHDPNTIVTNLSVGENIFQWTVYNGPCATTNTTDWVSIFLFDATQSPANAGQDQQHCTPNTTTQLAANSVIFPAEGTWSITQGNASFSDIHDPNAIVSNVAPGVNIFTWTVSNGPCTNSVTADDVTISIFNNNQSDAYAGIDQELCFPTTTTSLQGNPLTAAATGLWTLISGGGTITDPTNATTNLTDLPIGINVFVWSINNGPCGNSSDTLSVTVYDPTSPSATAGDDAYYCTPASTHTMSGNEPTYPAVGTWTLITGTGTIADPNDPHSLISGLTVGENIFIWSIYNGPCNPVTMDVMSIFIYNENTPNANAGMDQEICLPQNSVVTQASPAEFPAIGVWQVIEGSATIGDVNDPNTAITELPIGTNILVWTVDNGPCQNGITSDTIMVKVFDPNIAPPNAGPDQNICTPVSTTTMNGNQLADPNYGYWTLINGSGVIENLNDPNSPISGLAVGINTFTWTVYNGTCENAIMTDTVNINVFDQSQPAADAGEDQELCYPELSTTLHANHATVPAQGTWTVIEGSATFADIHDENTFVSGLSMGSNTFQWLIDNGPCENAVTSDMVTISVFNPQAVNAQAGSDMEICTPQECVQMNATPPIDPQVGTWSTLSAINGNGAIPFGAFDDVNNPTAQLCALSVGTHTLQWELYNGPCANNTSDVVVVSVYEETAPPANAGDDQELCGGNNQSQLAANTPVFPAVGTWNIIATTNGNPEIANINDPQSTITNLQIGVTTLTWTIYNGPCFEATTDTLIITVFDPQSPHAAAGQDQHFCENFPDTPMAANTPIFPAVGTWTIFSGGGNFSDVNDPTAMVSDIPLNENIYVWTIYNGACANSITSDTLSVYVNDMTVAAANAANDVFFCGAPDSLQLHGSVTVGLATSLWTIVQGGGYINNVLNNDPYLFDIPNGINTYEYTVDNGPCGITSDQVVVTVYDPELPKADAGTGNMICEHEFTSFNLMANAVNKPATGWWSVIEGPIEISDSTDAEALVLGMGEIETELVNVPSTLVWTVDNGVCGTTSDTVTFILEDCLSIKIPDAFSPNSDGVNDYWEIPNISSYPNNKVKIFNRWGTEVYHAAPYKNEWNGISIHPATLGTGLPVSTYYYILDLGTGTPVYTGFVYLKR